MAEILIMVSERMSVLCQLRSFEVTLHPLLQMTYLSRLSIKCDNSLDE